MPCGGIVLGEEMFEGGLSWGGNVGHWGGLGRKCPKFPVKHL